MKSRLARVISETTSKPVHLFPRHWDCRCQPKLRTTRLYCSKSNDVSALYSSVQCSAAFVISALQIGCLTNAYSGSGQGEEVDVVI
ncbi:hypothetical protein AC249_AIPGENE10203 [Exaiptasia diaphana]|nr:hypothetical protein AC249_AIPGENE10203 [Exaiptasia diaphana]